MDRAGREFGRHLPRGWSELSHGGWSTRPSSPARSGTLTRAAASIRATPTLVSRANATRPISATRRIWRWTRRAGWCAGRDDLSQRYPPLTTFKIVLLQQRHTLSDPAAEQAVRDRLSFRRFCGLPLEADTPTTPRFGGFARRSRSLACRRSYWLRSTGRSTRAASLSSAAG
jgi:hypothetical protein